jgi:hypothetical protein
MRRGLNAQGADASIVGPDGTLAPAVARHAIKASSDGYSAGGHRGNTLLHLIGPHILNVSGDIPSVTEGVLESPGAIAIELILDRA